MWNFRKLDCVVLHLIRLWYIYSVAGYGLVWSAIKLSGKKHPNDQPRINPLYIHYGTIIVQLCNNMEHNTN